MVSSFLDYDDNDPHTLAKEAAEALTLARREVDRKGLKAFLFNAASVEEFDERSRVREVADQLEETAAKYLGSRAGSTKVIAVLRREFIAGSSCDCKDGEECVCKGGECKCVKTSKVAISNDLDGLGRTTCHRPDRWYNPDTERCEHPEHDERVPSDEPVKACRDCDKTPTHTIQRPDLGSGDFGKMHLCDKHVEPYKGNPFWNVWKS